MKRILVVGDIMLDHYIYGTAERLSPEAPVPVVKFEREEYKLGGAGNVVANLRALDACVDYIGCVANDDEGMEIKELFLELKVGGKLHYSGRFTTTKQRIIANGQYQLLRVDNDNRTIPINLSLSACVDYDLIIVSDYGKGAIGPDTINQL